MKVSWPRKITFPISKRSMRFSFRFKITRQNCQLAIRLSNSYSNNSIVYWKIRNWYKISINKHWKRSSLQKDKWRWWLSHQNIASPKEKVLFWRRTGSQLWYRVQFSDSILTLRPKLNHKLRLKNLYLHKLLKKTNKLQIIWKEKW